MTTVDDPTTLLAEAEAAKRHSDELFATVRDAERAAHEQRQARRTEQYQGWLDTYSDAVNAKLVAAAEAKLMATDFFAALVNFIEARMWRGRARALADDAVYQGGATPRQPLPAKASVPIIADLYAEVANVVAMLAADVAVVNVEERIQLVHDRADEAYRSVSGREPTHYRVTAVSRPGDDFSEMVGGEPVFFTGGVAIVNAADPKMRYFRTAGGSVGMPAAYEVVGIFGTPSIHTEAEARFRRHVGAEAPSRKEPPAEAVAEAEASAAKALRETRGRRSGDAG